jgi:hypothetical protein
MAGGFSPWQSGYASVHCTAERGVLLKLLSTFILLADAGDPGSDAAGVVPTRNLSEELVPKGIVQSENLAVPPTS